MATLKDQRKEYYKKSFFCWNLELTVCKMRLNLKMKYLQQCYIHFVDYGQIQFRIEEQIKAQ